MRRVVVTGVGPVTPIGVGAAEFLAGQHEARNGIRHITRFDASELSVQIAGEVDVDVSAYIERRDARRLDRFVQLALIGAALALEDAGLSEDEVAGEHTGTCIGSGIGGLETWEAQSAIVHDRGVMRMSPFFIPMLIANMASGHIAMRYGLTGPSSSVVTACATGSGNIGDGFRMVQRGDADIVFAGGSEACVTPMGIGGFAVMKALSTRNDDPQRASRPFDKDRDGFIMAEGAGVLIFEELEHAKARGATIVAEVLGFGASADAYHLTAPEPDGLGAAMALRRALADAGVNPQDVEYINAHGTSTELGDIGETKAVKAVFGDHARKLAISSTKSQLGHLLGASGGAELITTILGMLKDTLPPTVNLENPDPQCDLDYVPNQPRPGTINVAVSNSFGFGGHNACIVVRRFAD